MRFSYPKHEWMSSLRLPMSLQKVGYIEKTAQCSAGVTSWVSVGKVPDNNSWDACRLHHTLKISFQESCCCSKSSMDSHFCLSLWLLNHQIVVGIVFDMLLWVRNRSTLDSLWERREMKDMLEHWFVIPWLSQMTSSLRVVRWNCISSWDIMEAAVRPWSPSWPADILWVKPCTGPLPDMCLWSFCISEMFPVDTIHAWDPRSFWKDASLAPNMHWFTGILSIISLSSSGGKWADPHNCWREVGRL